MPEPFIYIRGLPPGFPDALTDNTEMLADMKAVARLAEEQVSALRHQLSQAKGFLDHKALGSVVRNVLKDDDTAGSVQRVLRNLGPKSVDRLLRALSRREPEESLLTQAELGRLREILPRLIQPYPGLTRFEKAERLAKLTGQQLEAIELVCDLRPIFDDAREHLDGMMPYTRLLVTATGSDGLPNSFEAELTQQQVHDLADKVSKAKEKLDVLRKSIETWVPDGLPNLPLTRVPKKEPSDG